MLASGFLCLWYYHPPALHPMGASICGGGRRGEGGGEGQDYMYYQVL